MKGGIYTFTFFGLFNFFGLFTFFGLFNFFVTGGNGGCKGGDQDSDLERDGSQI